MALLLPAIHSVRERGRAAQCQNNLRQIGLGLLQFEETFGRFPPAMLQQQSIVPDYRQPRPYDDDKGWQISWMARILPYVGQDSLYAFANFQQGYYPWPNGERLPNGEYINGQVVSLFQCPSYPKDTGPFRALMNADYPEIALAHTDYLGVNGTDQFGGGSFQTKHLGILHVNSRVKVRDIVDGTSKTFMVGERPRSNDGWAGWWFAGCGLFPWFGAADVVSGTEERMANSNCVCEPTNEKSFFHEGKFVFEFDGFCYDKNAWHFWSAHSGGAHFLFADGHVEFVSYSIDRDLFRARGTFAGGETANGE